MYSIIQRQPNPAGAEVRSEFDHIIKTCPAPTKSMREPGAIVLISCYELGHQPVGLAMPMGFLEQEGFSPVALDIGIDKLDEEVIRRALFVGISTPMHTAMRIGISAAEKIRRLNQNCHICFYGMYATLNADYLLETVADSVIGGEYENELVQIVQQVESRSVMSRPVADSVKLKRAPYLKRLSFPSTNRKALPPLEKYAKLEWNGAEKLVGYVETTRGCLHHCLHCPIPAVYHGRFFAVPIDVIIDDIRQQVEMGAKHITFGDPDFLNGPTHSLRIVRRMSDEFPHLTFDFTAKVEHLIKHAGLIPEFQKTGCIFIISAVESLNNTVLKYLAKGHTREDVFRALDIVRSAEIALRPTWVAFTPWTTLDDYIEMVEFVYKEYLIDNVDPVQLSIRLLIPPDSRLLEQKEIQPYLGELDKASLYFKWKHPDPRMDELHKRVSQIVEDAACPRRDTAITFKLIREAAYEARDQRPPGQFVYPEFEDREKAPRLTEPWFCCAEPMKNQISI